MKKCSQCNKTYDDSWGICLHCSAPLNKLSDDPETLSKKSENWLVKSANMKPRDWFMFFRNQAIAFGIFAAVMYPIIWFMFELEAYHKGTFGNIFPAELTLYSPIFVVCLMFKIVSHLIGRGLYPKEGSK